jgi:hypothetical protein
MTLFGGGLLALVALILPAPARAHGDETWDASGTMQESFAKPGTNAYGTATGDLAGPYKAKFISTQDDGTKTTVTSGRTIDTAQGTLVLDEVGHVDDATKEVNAVSTVSGGSGIFKNASGTLYLSGQINANDTVTFTYSGTIDLED